MQKRNWTRFDALRKSMSFADEAEAHDERDYVLTRAGADLGNNPQTPTENAFAIYLSALDSYIADNFEMAPQEA